MSADVTALSNDLMKLTQEQSGASEAALGKIDPTQASGRAILAVQDASAQVMSLQMQQHEQFVEDIARILLDFWTTYAADAGKTVRTEDGTGQPKTLNVQKAVLEHLKVNVKIETSPTSPYSMIAIEQTLENFLQAKYITFEELVEALPDNSVAPKQILKNILHKRQELAAKQAKEQAEAQARAQKQAQAQAQARAREEALMQPQLSPEVMQQVQQLRQMQTGGVSSMPNGSMM